MNGWEDLSRLSEYPLFHAPGALLAALSVFGLLIGALTGLFGVGGAFLLVPMLKLLFGIPYPVGVASSFVTLRVSGARLAREPKLSIEYHADSAGYAGAHTQLRSARPDGQDWLVTLQLAPRRTIRLG